MEAQTLTGVSNFDGPTLMLGLNNGEATTINGGSLTIDSDVRWNQNAAVHGSITVSSTLGGTVLFEGRNVWELPYSSRTGNVPAQAALGSNSVTGGTSGATGELLRVWAAGAITPTLTGAMPATGWVKLRSKTGNFTTGEVVTLPGGATITLSGPGKRSWLHIVGAENGTISIPRLGDVKWRGDWHELGLTNGADDQTFQFPVADACPALWIEKSVGSFAADGMAGMEPWLSAGTRWGIAGTRWGTTTQFVATDVRGKYFGQDLATGVITIARRATNACGFKPVTGLRVFMPNLILSSSSATNWALNLLNSDTLVRYKTATTQGGDVDAQGVCSNWFFNCSTPVSVDIRRSGFMERVDVITPANPIFLEDFAIGVRLSTVAYTSLVLRNVFDGGVFRRGRCARASQGEALTLDTVSNVVFRGIQVETFGLNDRQTRGATSILCVVMAQCSGLDFDGFSVLGARLRVLSSVDTVIRNFEYSDAMQGTTTGISAMPAVEVGSGSDGFDMYGFANFGGLENIHTSQQLLICGGGSSKINLYDVGTPTAPYDMGTVNPATSIVFLGSVRGSVLRRVYTQNANVVGAGSPVILTSTARDVEITNVWSDGDDNARIGGTNVVARGCRFTGSSGQTASYGRHWEDSYTSTTAGLINILCTEPTDATADQCVPSFAPGSGFTSAGGVSMATVGDFVEWTMNYFALGHTSLDFAEPLIWGTNPTNHALTFQADTGSGFSVSADMTGANLAAVGAIDPATGIKLRVRATVVTANPNNLLTAIRTQTVTDAVSQRIQYPITAPFNLTLTNLIVGSAIRVETQGSGATVFSATAVSTEMTLPLTAGASGDPANNLRIKVRKGSASPFFRPFETQATAFAGAQTIFVSQIPDE